jgi:hypothetical protein
MLAATSGWNRDEQAGQTGKSSNRFAAKSAGGASAPIWRRANAPKVLNGSRGGVRDFARDPCLHTFPERIQTVSPVFGARFGACANTGETRRILEHSLGSYLNIVHGSTFRTIARRSASDHDLFRSATAQQNHDPVLDFRSSQFLEQRPALAGGLHWHATSEMPPSRRIAEAGFKDSAVKKLAWFRRIRTFAIGLMMAI